MSTMVHALDWVGFAACATIGAALIVARLRLAYWRWRLEQELQEADA